MNENKKMSGDGDGAGAGESLELGGIRRGYNPTLFVLPCVLLTDVYIMQECDNKVMQKSHLRILWNISFLSHESI